MLGEITVVLAGAMPSADLPTLVAEVEAWSTAGMRRQGRLRRGGRRASRARRHGGALRRGAAVAARVSSGLTAKLGGMTAPDDRRRLVQAFLPLGVRVGVGGDAAADAEHRVARGVELDGADRDVQFASGHR